MKYRLVCVRGDFTVKRGYFGKFGKWVIINNIDSISLPCFYPLQVLPHIFYRF